MKNLDTLLERFKRSLGDDSSRKEEIIDCINTLTKIKLSIKEISIKNGALEINTSPTKNNEIRLKEEAIILFLKTRQNLGINKIFYK